MQSKPQEPSPLHETSEALLSLTIEEIQKFIPHRYPMLLVDRLQDIVLGERAVGIKNITMNEWFFPGHFPQKPVMPGVLIIEAMAQTAGVLVMKTLSVQKPLQQDELVYFMSIENARFRKLVVPGDTLKIQVTKQHHRGNVWKFLGEAYVEDGLVADATYTAMITSR